MDILYIKRTFDRYCESIADYNVITESYCGLVKGDMGLILCNGYFYKLFNEYKYFNEIQVLTKKIFNRSYNNYSLGYGLAGLAWTVELLKQAELLECNRKWVEKIDILLAKEGQKQILNGHLDYFSGGAGILNYFLCKQVKEDVVFDLACLYINEISKKIISQTKNFNLGVPHGLIGDILLLIKLKVLLQFQVESLIGEIVDILWKSRNPIGSISILPYFQNDKKETTLAWCYGDLPFMYCLIKMKVCNIPFDYPKELEFVFEQTLNRTDCYRDNNTLCHGSIVVALLYHQMWKITGIEKYFLISEDWKRYSYEVWNRCYLDLKKKGKNVDYYSDSSLFNGPSGFFLSMFSMENINFMNWEQCLII